MTSFFLALLALVDHGLVAAVVVMMEVAFMVVTVVVVRHSAGRCLHVPTRKR